MDLDHGSQPAHTPYLAIARCVFRPTGDPGVIQMRPDGHSGPRNKWHLESP
jgi:hypothetical protein